MRFLKEFAIILSIVIITLWLINEYLAYLVSLIFVPICMAILLISLVAEWIEPSKVPRSYFSFLLTAILIIILWFVFFNSLNGWTFDWLKNE